MRLFVGEYVCGGGFAQQPVEAIPESLREEGTAMWRALVEDLAKICSVVTPIDARWNLNQTGVQAVLIQSDSINASEASLWQAWLSAAQDCDAALLIAPETQGVLERGVRAFRDAGVRVLAPGDAVVQLASDKRLTTGSMIRAGIPHPVPDAPATSDSTDRSGWVIKPCDGCGSCDVRWFVDLASARVAMNPGDLIQRYVLGEAVSMLAITSLDGSTTLLPGVRQNILSRAAGKGSATLHYVGGCGPVSPELQSRMEHLARRTLAALPGPLTGFIGLDMVLGADPADDHLIEINPRLTTSYVGLRMMVEENIAHRLLVADPSRIATSRLRETVHWDTRGRIQIR